MNLQSIINKLKTYHYTAFEILYYWEHSPFDFLDSAQLSKDEVDFLRATNSDSKIVINTLYPNGVKPVDKDILEKVKQGLKEYKLDLLGACIDWSMEIDELPVDKIVSKWANQNYSKNLNTDNVSKKFKYQKLRQYIDRLYVNFKNIQLTS